MANLTYLRFIEEQPEAAEAFRALVARTTAAGALDEKTKQLIFLAAVATTGYGEGMTAHIDKILAAGGTADEIREALLVTVPVTGIMNLLKVYDLVEDHLAKVAPAG